MKKEKEPRIELIENFGDTYRIVYNKTRNRMECVGRLSPTDTSRLIQAIADHYSSAKKAKGKRIYALASELWKLIKDDCTFFTDTVSLVAIGNTILLEPDKITIDASKED